MITVCINDKTGFDNAANAYLGVLKYGAAGNETIDSIALTDSTGRIIHTFSNDDAIKHYAVSLNPSNGNLAETMGDISAFTGMIGDGIESSTLSNISALTGAYKTYEDIKRWSNNKNFDNTTDLIIDSIGFIPNGGAFSSYALSEVKEVSKEIIEIEKEYQKKELLNNFSTPEKRQIDLGHLFIKSLKQTVKSIRGRNK